MRRPCRLPSSRSPAAVLALARARASMPCCLQTQQRQQAQQGMPGERPRAPRAWRAAGAGRMKLQG